MDRVCVFDPFVPLTIMSTGDVEGIVGAFLFALRVRVVLDAADVEVFTGFVLNEADTPVGFVGTLSVTLLPTDIPVRLSVTDVPLALPFLSAIGDVSFAVAKLKSAVEEGALTVTLVDVVLFPAASCAIAIRV